MTYGPVTVYWRPGCIFCMGLLRALERSELAFERVNIWERPDAAAFVRAVTGGNETVPTVRIGDAALINPTAAAVLRGVAVHAPQQLAPGEGLARQRLLARLLTGFGGWRRPRARS